MAAKVDCQFKILVIGESGVGKTSLTRRFELGKFQTRAHTVLADFCKKEIVVKDKRVELRIFDTAGHEEYRERVLEYFKEVDGVLLVYDVTDMMTFNKLSSWLSKVRELSNGSITLIVGNKIDHPNGKSVTRETVKQYARDEGLEFMETSAKKGDNVGTVFEHLTLKILQNKHLVPPDSSSSVHLSVSPSGSPPGADVAVPYGGSCSVPKSLNVTPHKSEASSGIQQPKLANEGVAHQNSPQASRAEKPVSIAASGSKTEQIVEAEVHCHSNPSKENGTSANEFPNQDILPPVVCLNDEDIPELYVNRVRKMSTDSISSLCDFDYVMVHRQEVLAEQALSRQEALAMKARSRKNSKSDCNLL